METITQVNTLRSIGRPKTGNGPSYNIPDVIFKHESGQTLQMIGDFYGVTRERIRQILKSAGITSKSGGRQRIASFKIKVKERRQLISRILQAAAYGLTVEEFKANGPVAKTGTPLYKYNTFKHYVEHYYGSTPDLTFHEWKAVWDASGNEISRKWSIVRKNLDKPWTYENVHIISSVQRGIETQERVKSKRANAMNDIAIHNVNSNAFE